MDLFDRSDMAGSSVVRSLSFDQREIIEGIANLHTSGLPFDVDMTYGNGQFWKGLPQPRFCYDIDPQVEGVVKSDSRSLPLPSCSVSSVVFDPPFLTYIRSGRDGNGQMAMAKRFAGYWTYAELEQHYTASILEARRILSKGGVLIVKCQDIVHNHKIHATHCNVVRWADDCDFRLLDLFVLGANHRMPSPNRAGKQKHARVFHSYFLVFKAV